MKTIKVCYTIDNNIGDQINPLIIENVLGYKPVHSKASECRMSGIGSGLYRYFVQVDRCLRSPKLFLSLLKNRIFNNNELIIWSSGFIDKCDKKEIRLRKNMKVASVRGAYSKKRIETIVGYELKDTTLGDGGLLVSELLDKKDIEKKYKIGIVPHKRELNDIRFDKLKNMFDDSIIIDVTNPNPMDTIRLFSQCECILSSSLHGLIIADSFLIPNQHIICSDKLVGDGSKFDDYYSAFNYSHKPLIYKDDLEIDVQIIKENYYLTEDMLNNKKKEIKEAFYKYL